MSGCPIGCIPRIPNLRKTGDYYCKGAGNCSPVRSAHIPDDKANDDERQNECFEAGPLELFLVNECADDNPTTPAIRHEKHVVAFLVNDADESNQIQCNPQQPCNAVLFDFVAKDTRDQRVVEDERQKATRPN